MRQDFKVGDRVVVSSSHTDYSEEIMNIDRISEDGLLGFNDYINRDIWFYPEEAYHDHRALYEEDSSYHYYFYPYKQFDKKGLYVLEAVYDFCFGDTTEETADYIKNGIDSLKIELEEEYERMAMALIKISNYGTPDFIYPEHRFDYITRIVLKFHNDILANVEWVMDELGLQVPEVEFQNEIYGVIKVAEAKARRINVTS